jgi:flagellar secretion chaperone FliS
MVPNAYARTYQTQAILTASPGQLVLMLYDGALRFLAQAQAAMERDESDWRRIEVIHRNLQKAQNIIAELRGTLDHDAGGPVAANLDQLYEYYIRRLHEANVKKDRALVAEVEGMLRELRDGWSEMLQRTGGGGANPTRGIRNVA